MPYLQLDVPNSYPVDVKRRLARRAGDVFARVMQTTPEQITVAIRELGEGSLWRCGPGEPEPAALLMCDVRRGRPVEQRAELAAALVAVCVEDLGLRSEVYEYRCDECGELFEQTETLAEHEARRASCPKCKSERVSRRFSTFQVKTSRKS